MASFFRSQRDVPLPEKFGVAVAALVAGDRLPPAYPEMVLE